MFDVFEDHFPDELQLFLKGHNKKLEKLFHARRGFDEAEAEMKELIP